jgi:hypothetical protein
VSTIDIYWANLLAGRSPNTSATREDNVVNNDELEARVGAGYRNLDRVIQWIMSADTKALIFLTFDGVLVGVLAANSGSITQAVSVPRPAVWAWIVIFISTAFGVTYILSVLLLLIVLFPRVKTPRGADTESLFFFGSIDAMDRAKFILRAKGLTRLLIEDTLLDQIFVNSKIAATKYRYLRTSVVMIVVAVVLLAADVAALLLSATHIPLGQ